MSEILKEGNYTTIGGYEYKIEQRQSLEISHDGPGYVYPYRPTETHKFETVIITYDKEATDETFTFDEEKEHYVKVIDPKTITEVVNYGISYYYKGHKVDKLGGRDKFITLYLDYKDSELAMELGFKEHDRTEFIKTVDISEVEMKQEICRKIMK